MNDTVIVNDQQTKKTAKEFDHSKYAKRHVALMIAYVGWDYDGFVVQDNNENTVEKYLFEALYKTKLIESRETSNYHRCGRTDKGVSAFRQVISIDLRSKTRIDSMGKLPEQSDEYNYANLLNRVLPVRIKILAWAPIDQEFSSRFDCKLRTYRYYFPRSSLDIEAMQEACSFLIGQHDFRNFCKVDMTSNKVTHCIRDLYEAFITVAEETVNIEESSSSRCYNLCFLTIKASSFIWHQIRCIMAVLLLVGEKKEQPEIIQKLLDIEKQTAKPHYPLALDSPLILYNCEYDVDSVKWNFDEYSLKRVVSEFQRIWAEYSIKANMMKDMIGDIEKRIGSTVNSHHQVLLPGNNSSKKHIPLLKRPTSDSVEEKMLKSAKKCRLKEAKQDIMDCCD